MPRFRFTLASVLRLREAAREERQAALAEAYRAEETLRRRDEELLAALAELGGRSRRAAAPGRIDVDELLDAERYGMILLAERRQLTEQRRLLAEEVARRQAALVEANREVRVLEKLRDRKREQFEAEENRRAIQQLDEAAGLRALRQEEWQ